MTTKASRREFVKGLAMTGMAASVGVLRGAAAAAQPARATGPAVLTGTEFDLRIGEIARQLHRPNAHGHRPSTARCRRRCCAGAKATRSRCASPTRSTRTRRSTGTASCCRPTWTACRASASTASARRDATPTASRCSQCGTYWYHSHSGFQEQLGLYGPLVIEPREPRPVRVRPRARRAAVGLDRRGSRARLREAEEAVRLLQLPPAHGRRLLPRRRARTASARRWPNGGCGAQMRMNADRPRRRHRLHLHLPDERPAPAGNWTGLFTPGERVRLRFINGSAMTYFDVRIPGLKMTVVAADGQPVQPVTVDEFRIAVAETYDVIVEPSGQDGVHDLRAVHGSHGLRARHAGRARRAAARRCRRSIRAPLLTMADMGHMAA